MAPSKNDKYIWIALGLGGLYLLSRKDDDDKEVVHVKVDVKPPVDWGEGKVGVKRPAEDDSGKQQQLDPPTYDDWTTMPKLEKKGEGGGYEEGPIDRKYRLLRQKIQNLDSKISQIYQLYDSHHTRATGTISPAMFSEMRKTISVMMDLKTEIQRFLQEPGVMHGGVRYDQSSFDLNVIVQQLTTQIQQFNQALTTHTQNQQINQGRRTAEAFLELYANVRRALRDRRLKSQFLQQFDDRHSPSIERGSPLDIPESELFGSDDESSERMSEASADGRKENRHGDDSKFRLKKDKRGREDDPNFRAGEKSAEGMSQAQIEANSRTEVWGEAGTQHNGELDPDAQLAGAIGKSENRDQNLANNSLHNPKAKLEGGNSNAKKKGPAEDMVVDLTGAEAEVEDTFNSAPGEENLITSGIERKGAANQRTKGREKPKTSAQAVAEMDRPGKSTAFKKKDKARGGKKRKKAKLQEVETDGTVKDAFGANPPEDTRVTRSKARDKNAKPVEAVGKMVQEELGSDYKEDVDRDRVWARLKDYWDKAQRAVKQHKPLKRQRTHIGTRLKQIANEVANLKFVGGRQKMLYQLAKWLYGTRNFKRHSAEKFREVVAFLESHQDGKYANEARAGASVWAYFCAVYSDLSIEAQKLGVKLLWSETSVREDPSLPVESPKKRKKTNLQNLGKSAAEYAKRSMDQ